MVDERFRCAEALFDPSLVGLKDLPIHELVRESLGKVDPDLLAPLLSTIVLSGTLQCPSLSLTLRKGGNGMLQGLKARLSKELKRCLPSSYPSFTIREAKKLAAWKGGATMAASPWFVENGITQELYDEYGPSLVHRRCY